MPTVEVRRTYLVMTAPGDLRASRPPAAPLEVARHDAITVPEYRALYGAVGAAWHWRDRDAWSDDELSAYLAQPDVSIWIARVEGHTAGYFELRSGADGAVEIVYFGLVPEFIGRGFGGALLTRAVQEAWALGAARVCLNTCTLDAPQALPNYLARGFRIEYEETYTATIR